MEENLKWLWYAFSLAWVVHVLYAASLSARQRKLEQQLRDLRSQLDDRE